MSEAMNTHPTIQIPIFGENERIIPIAELLDGRDIDMASISDADLLEQVVNFLDLDDVEELKRLVMGSHYDSSRELKVSRPSTGNILIAASVMLG